MSPYCWIPLAFTIFLFAGAAISGTREAYRAPAIGPIALTCFLVGAGALSAIAWAVSGLAYLAFAPDPQPTPAPKVDYVYVKVDCAECEGTGKTFCPVCKGTGISQVEGFKKGEPCPACDRTNTKYECPMCGGSGKLLERR